MCNWVFSTMQRIMMVDGKATLWYFFLHKIDCSENTRRSELHNKFNKGNLLRRLGTCWSRIHFFFLEKYILLREINEWYRRGVHTGKSLNMVLWCLTWWKDSTNQERGKKQILLKREWTGKNISFMWLVSQLPTMGAAFVMLFFDSLRFQHNNAHIYFPINRSLGSLLLLVHAGISLSTALVEIFPVLLIRCPIFLHCEYSADSIQN